MRIFLLHVDRFIRDMRWGRQFRWDWLRCYRFGWACRRDLRFMPAEGKESLLRGRFGAWVHAKDREAIRRDRLGILPWWANLPKPPKAKRKPWGSLRS